MAPKRSRRKLIGTVVRSTRKVVKETIRVSVEEGNDAQESTQEPEDIVESLTKDQTRIIPAKGNKQGEVQDVENITITSKEHSNDEGERMEQEDKPKRPETSKRDGRGKERKRKTAARGGGEGYKRYLFKVMKQVHPEMRISSMAMSIINSLMNDIFERLGEEAARLSQYAKRRTLSSLEIQDAVKLVLPGQLGTHAIAEGSKAVTSYVTYRPNKS